MQEMQVRSLGGKDPLEDLQYSRLGNPMARGAWRGSSRGCKESDTTKRLNNNCLMGAMRERGGGV